MTVLECLQGSGARREIMFLKVNPGHLGRLGGSHELFVIQVVPVIRLGYVDTYLGEVWLRIVEWCISDRRTSESVCLAHSSIRNDLNPQCWFLAFPDSNA